MKYDAKWFFNFFNAKDNWCSGTMADDRDNYCAVGHLNRFMGEQRFKYDLPIVEECQDIIGEELININDARDASGHYLNPKTSVLKALRKAIKLIDPQCQLGKEYDA